MTVTSFRVTHDTSDGESGTTAKTDGDTTRHQLRESNPQQFLLTLAVAAN